MGNPGLGVYPIPPPVLPFVRRLIFLLRFCGFFAPHMISLFSWNVLAREDMIRFV